MYYIKMNIHILQYNQRTRANICGCGSDNIFIIIQIFSLFGSTELRFSKINLVRTVLEIIVNLIMVIFFR